MPVGCVPSAAVAVFVGGWVACPGVSAQEGGVCLGGCLSWWGSLPRGGVCPVGVSACLPAGGDYPGL